MKYNNETIKEIKSYPDKIIITTIKNKEMVISDIGNCAGEFTKDEWKREDPISLFNDEDKDIILQELEQHYNGEYFKEVEK